MLTKMTDTDWGIVVAAFRAARSRRGEKGRDDRKFLEALHYFTLLLVYPDMVEERGGPFHKGGRKAKLSAARAAGFPPKST